MNIASRTVSLAKNGERIVFDVDRDLYRVAYYYPKLQDGKQVGENRITAKHKKLCDALTIVFGESNSKHDPLTVEHYMRSASWGRELP